MLKADPLRWSYYRVGTMKASWYRFASMNLQMKYVRRNKGSDVFNIRCSRIEGNEEEERVNDDEKESLSDTSIIRD